MQYRSNWKNMLEPFCDCSNMERMIQDGFIEVDKQQLLIKTGQSEFPRTNFVKIIDGDPNYYSTWIAFCPFCGGKVNQT